MNDIQPVVMAGGIGTRLWPISNEINSKQFLKIFAGKSLFQLTLIRNFHLGKPLVITNNKQNYIAQIQIEELGYDADIIVEPMQKNTAACAIIASIYGKINNKTKIALFPSDHYITGHEKYRASLKKALLTLRQNPICTIGIKPLNPHTGYGYIEVEENTNDQIGLTKTFTEKPTKDLAEHYLSQSNYYWNSGMLFFDANYMQVLSRKYIPNILENVKKSVQQSYYKDSFIFLSKEPYANIPSISIDHSILQNLYGLAFLEANFSWRDIGNWDALWNFYKNDYTEKYVDNELNPCSFDNSFPKTNEPQTSVIGLNNVVVLGNGSNIMLANTNKSINLNSIIEEN